MNNNDYLVKAITKDGSLRAFAINATNTVKTAQKIHDTWSASSAALGRTIVGSGLLAAAELKDDQHLTVRVAGDGPVGGIIVDADAQGHLRGYIQNPHVNLPLNNKGKIDVQRVVGKNGSLSVTKDLGLKQPFTGQVPLISGELGEDFTYYLAKSEQIPSAVGLSVFVNADNTIGVAGGFLVQALPGATDAELTKLEKTIKELPLVSQLLREGNTPEQILERIFGTDQLKFLGTEAITYHCNCSKEHFADLLATLSDKELNSMINDDHGAEVTCKFCGKHYRYSEAELRDILKQKHTK
ncbi:MAG: Hsp33 family molecular chaperone HslO [Candidatus Paralactobacillus gallistercoris]|uniref:33 kDa chaperonin n=1 Tax=Candidatus Paralactobacillus gallistercoris TaxID=2838724 RepID=A0A948TJL5_9LACO|nr:Hsp33 family molecular chaperone HslO [Candidatus Paralactobacillus gallistercoris]